MKLAKKYAKYYCNRTPIVKVIVENVVTCFFGGHSVRVLVALSSRSLSDKVQLVPQFDFCVINLCMLALCLL